MMAWRLLWRDWKSGRLGLIAAALVLAVAVVASVAMLADRVQSGLSREVSSFLAADLKLRSDTAIDPQYLSKAQELELQTAQTAVFASMVFFGETNHLASVKAVGDAYPLRGALTLADAAFTTDDEDWIDVVSAPAPGEIWVEERLLPMLGMEIGDSLEVGEHSLSISKVLIHEPDRGSGFSMTGARVLMNYADLDATGVILPGSRVRYALLLASNTSDSLASYEEWAREIDDPHLRVITPERAEGRLSETLDRGTSFLLLAGTVGLLLAAVALALSSDRYAERHKDQVALMKSWGQSSTQIRSLLFKQLAVLGSLSALLGLFLGWFAHLVLLWTVRDLLPQTLPPPSVMPMVTAVVTGFLCLIGFALPALWHLPAIAPLRVLRRDVPVTLLSSGARFAIGAGLMILILLWYSSSLILTMLFIAAAVVVTLVLGGLAYLALNILRKVASPAGSIWRLAMGNLWRRRLSVILQSVAFSFTIMLLFIMISMRTSLLADWRMQLPEDAPNHFLVNMMTWEVDAIQDLLEESGLETADWYPMVRGRLTAQNGDALTRDRLNEVDGLDREVNLTWSSEFPEANELVEGEWWLESEPNTDQFSLEEEVANQLGVEIGDIFTFSVGGREFDATLTSLRSVDWDSMLPNFYVIFPPGVLEDYSPNWITSTYLERSDKTFINALLTAHPTVLVIALDEIIGRIRTVIDRVSVGLEMMLLMILACGVLVLFAAIASSFEERLRESAILRTLGSSRKLILGALGLEFLFMGLVSGIVAALGAQLAVFALQVNVFNMSIVWYPWIWLAGPLVGAILVTGLGLIKSYSLVTLPPLQSLRQLG